MKLFKRSNSLFSEKNKLLKAVDKAFTTADTRFTFWGSVFFIKLDLDESKVRSAVMYIKRAFAELRR